MNAASGASGLSDHAGPEVSGIGTSGGGDLFGYAVALDANTALIGAPSSPNPGSVYFFFRSGDSWTEQGRIVDLRTGTAFGTAVALSGDTALVGAPSNYMTDTGLVYVYRRQGEIRSEQAVLKPSDGMGGDKFGIQIAFDGTTALIGAPSADDLGDAAGATYVFVRKGDTWIEQAKLLASDGAAGDGFGQAVALDGSTALAGAPWDNGLGLNTGSAYFYELIFPNGTPCAEASSCESGFCIDGVCCESACGGDAPNCWVCSVVAGAPEDGVCALAVEGGICRPAADLCDAPEVCNGVDRYARLRRQRLLHGGLLRSDSRLRARSDRRLRRAYR